MGTSDGEFGVTERAEPAADRGDEDRDHERGPGAHVVGSAGCGGADAGEDPRSDDRPDAEGDELDRPERPLHPVLRRLGVGQDPVEGLRSKETAAHAKLARRIPEARRRALLFRFFREGRERLRIRSGTSG